MDNVARTVETLGLHFQAVEDAISRLNSENIISRIWQGDHLVWDENPAEIVDRLGWLTLPANMRGELELLSSFASEVRSAGFNRVVLLGMGGSCLGPEVLRRTCGNASGYPELSVLDSTLPAWIEAVDEVIDPAKTLFLVSSKSGSTIESNTLYSYFWERVSKVVGEEAAGGNFVAITDTGTGLESLAGNKGFRRAFLNSPEVGGRYSVLSYFGMVPAALIGLDLSVLLGRAEAMQNACTVVNAAENAGARLGAVMATMALEGRDKLTLITSPALAGFGLWVEQMLAESLGKSGKGIIPVAGEPALSREHYSEDRLIVYLRLNDDDNARTDALVAELAFDHPTVQLELTDRFDLCAEFYRWEFATAVAGHILGVHPFDQPNVQGAKDKTDLVLGQFEATGALPQVGAADSAGQLVSLVTPGDYIAILAYLPNTPEVTLALESFRKKLTEKCGVPTTAGFGPRYLHSTGQLHKGGPGSGVYLQLTGDHPADLAIPGRSYTFGTLADAQSTGDLQALQALGRRTARVHLGDQPASGIQRLESLL